MKRWFAARLAAWLWPYVRPFVLDVLTAREQAAAVAKQDSTVRQAERVARRYVGER